MPGMGRSLQTGNSLVVSSFHTALFHQLLFVLPDRRPVRDRLQRRPDHPVPAAQGTRPDGISDHLLHPRSRTTGAARASHRLRLPLGARRPAADPVVHAAGPPLRRDRTLGHRLADLGPAPGEQRRDHLVRSSGRSRCRHGLDPGRTGDLVARRTARTLVAPGWSGDRRLGAPGLDVRRGLRRHLRPGAHVALRGSRRRRLLLRRRPPDRPTRSAPSPRPDSVGSSSGSGGSSSWAWRSCRPGRGAARGKGVAAHSTPWCTRWQQTPQPAFLSSWLGSFGSFDDAHGWGVNLFVVSAWPASVHCSSPAGAIGAGRARGLHRAVARRLGARARTWDFWAASAPTRTRCCRWPCSSVRATWPSPACPVEAPTRRFAEVRHRGGECTGPVGGRGGAGRRSRTFCASRPRSLHWRSCSSAPPPWRWLPSIPMRTPSSARQWTAHPTPSTYPPRRSRSSTSTGTRCAWPTSGPRRRADLPRSRLHE